MNMLAHTFQQMTETLARVADIKPSIFICSQRFGSDIRNPIRILLDGEYYDVGEHELALLRSGISPDDLELNPVEDEEDFS